MSNAPPPPASDANAAVAATPAVDIAKVEIPVHFDLGSAIATVGLLETIESGYVFELDRRVDRAVTISVGGAAIGRGELVRIGDRVGVRVVEVYDDASGPA